MWPSPFVLLTDSSVSVRLPSHVLKGGKDNRQPAIRVVASDQALTGSAPGSRRSSEVRAASNPVSFS